MSIPKSLYDNREEKIVPLYKLSKSDIFLHNEINVKYKNIYFYVTHSENQKIRYYYFEPFTKTSGFTFSIKDLKNAIKYEIYERSLKNDFIK